MRVLISGASGLVGSALIEKLSVGSCRLSVLTRGPRPNATDNRQLTTDNCIPWDPAAGELNTASVDGFDAVVHLAGENIAQGRWTADKKARILDSRVQGTGLLCRALAETARPPKVLVSASAVGYYGNRGDEELDETSAAGTGFLAEVCRQWEAAAEPAAAAGIRVVCARLGVVLARHGGALARMLPIFRFGLGGRLGSGQQYMSWIALGDAVEAICHVIATHSLSGPVNLVSPNPVSNREFTKVLGRVLHRPTIFPVPAFVLRLALGEMAGAMLLSSARAMPRRLLASGFQFKDARLDDAIKPQRH
jgi:uncharacterized protein (TIGR01777 family)